MSDILPCPFCGGNHVLDIHFEDDTVNVDPPVCDVEFVVIRCPSCGFSKEFGVPDNAMRWWNTRATPQREEMALAPMSNERPQSLQGMIREIYGNLDAEDCAMVDREWARMRGYILSTSGSSRLICVASPAQEETALKDAHDHLKAAIAEMKSIGNEPPMSIYKAMHALTHALTEANDRGHYAEGTAALAMKHRDEAETRLTEIEKFSRNRIADLLREQDRLCKELEQAYRGCDAVKSQLAQARKALERISSDEKNCTDYCRRQAKAAWLGKPVRDLDEARSSWLTASVDASSLTDYEVKPSNEPTDAVLSSAQGKSE